MFICSLLFFYSLFAKYIVFRNGLQQILNPLQDQHANVSTSKVYADEQTYNNNVANGIRVGQYCVDEENLLNELGKSFKR